MNFYKKHEIAIFVIILISIITILYKINNSNKNEIINNEKKENPETKKPLNQEQEKLSVKENYIEKITEQSERQASNLSNKIEQEIVDSGKFSDDFEGSFRLEETGRMTESASQSWWVNSGAFLFVNNGTGKTIFGDLNKGDYWQKKYKDYNSDETDKGLHPQNIFRLVNRYKWKNFQQECYYKINQYILSKAKERGSSNGILLFNRYQDGDNLYYIGLRVDGTVIIKKKKKGEYYTMAQKAFYFGQYNRKKNPNLLPKNRWLGVRSVVTDAGEGKVNIKVYLDRNRTGEWQLVAEATDDGKKFGGKAITDAGHAGLRTDFMDVEFDDYKIEELSTL